MELINNPISLRQLDWNDGVTAIQLKQENTQQVLNNEN